MITLTIDNSYSKITGLSASQEKELKSILSYKVGSHFSGFGIQKKSLLSKKGEFPTGLLHRLPHWAMAIIDSRVKPKLIVTPLTDKNYEWQISAMSVAIRQHRGIITAPTGTGKSRVISMISTVLGLKTLVIVPSLEIKKQLSSILPKNVTVENIDSKALHTAKDFDVLIIDEGHHVAAKTYQKLNKTAWSGIYYRFYLTATPFRNDNEETLLFESIAGQVIYKLDYQTAIKEHYIVPVEAYTVECPKQSVKGYTYNEVYSEMVVNNTLRNVILAQLLTDLHTGGKSTLCLVKEVRHGKLLQDLTGLPFINGDDEDSRKYIKLFNEGANKVVIATTAMMGEGIDTKPCEYVIIAGLGKAKSQFMQQIGRAVRTYPGKESAKIVLIQDKSHKFLTRHYRAQCAILRDEYGVKPVKLEIT